jgi:hypothetical protein
MRKVNIHTIDLTECAAPEVRFEDIVSHLLEPRFGPVTVNC